MYADFRPQISVLIVEDHFVTLQGLDAWFTASGDFKVVGHAMNTDDAAKLALALQPDVILLDLHLPGQIAMPGLLAKLKLNGSKIVIFSAEQRGYLVKLALRHGAAAYVSKSSTYDVLTQALKKVALGGCDRIPLLSVSGRAVTPVEEQILELMAKGCKYDDIAKVRSTSPHTIRKQCDRLQIKIGVPSREALIVWAVNNGFGASPSSGKI